MGKSTHFFGQPVYGQLIKSLDRDKIVELSRKNGGEKYVKSFNGFTHLLTMLYAVIMRFDSLCEIEAAMKYAEEADVLNVAMFGMTAKQWREAYPALKGNIRDYATINELICLSNIENINAVLINDGMPQGERLVKLNQIAIQQMQVLEDNSGRRLLK